MKDSYSFDRDREGLDALLRAARRGLRPDLRPRRARVVPGGVRRGDDGRRRRARVHGALRGGRERRGAVGRRLRRQRGGRERHAAAGRGAARAARRARAGRHAGRHDDRRRWPGSSACPPARSSRRCRWSSRTAAPLLVLVRGDHRLNEIKLAERARRAGPAGRAEEEMRERLRRRAGLHRPGRARACRCWPTRRCAGWRGLVAGANEPDRHLRGVEPGRDFEPELGRRAHASRPATRCPGRRRRSASSPRSRSGNIFKLGTRYSEPLGATYLDEDGHGAARSGWAPTGSARRGSWPPPIEQFADEQGISWPRALAPFDVELVTLGKEGEEARDAWPTGSTRSCASRASTCSTTTATPARARSSPTPSCSGCPLRLTVGQARRRGRRGRGRRCGAARRSARCRSRARPRRRRSCGASLP